MINFKNMFFEHFFTLYLDFSLKDVVICESYSLPLQST